MQEIRIKIVKWEKYQHRKDTKNPWWFSVHNELWRNPEFSIFTAEEKVVWYAVLAIAGKRKNAEIIIDLTYLAQNAGVDKNSVLTAIEKCKNNNWIEGTCTESVRNLYETRTLHNITRHNITLQNIITKGREEDMLPSLKRTPKFREYVEDYFAHYAAAQHEKRSSTLATERVHLNAWVQHLGGVRLEDITQGMIDKFLAKRQAEAVSPRTVNLALTCLRNVLNRAKTAKLITQLPTDGFRPLKWLPRQRQLFSAAEIEMLCAAAFNPVYQGGNLAPRGERGVPLKNAQQFADFIELLASCGSRMSDRAQLSGPVEC